MSHETMFLHPLLEISSSPEHLRPTEIENSYFSLSSMYIPGRSSYEKVSPKD